MIKFVCRKCGKSNSRAICKISVQCITDLDADGNISSIRCNDKIEKSDILMSSCAFCGSACDVIDTNADNELLTRLANKAP